MSELFEAHACGNDAWGCIICDIEMMYVRCILREPTATIVRGGDWVMIVPPEPWTFADVDGFIRSEPHL